MRGFKCFPSVLHDVPNPYTIPDLKDEVTLARYPFLPQAKSWIAEMASAHQIDIDELLDGSMMERSRIRARSRLIDSVDSKDGVEVASIGDIHTVEGRLLEAFSFYYARLVVGASEDERLISRWAQAEAERAGGALGLEEVEEQDEDRQGAANPRGRAQADLVYSGGRLRGGARGGARADEPR